MTAPPAPPLSTASDTYGWLCEEFALVAGKVGNGDGNPMLPEVLGRGT
jgi:hypothetical protein